MYQNIHKQQGIGLIEVMVSLLLLAVAVLGFSAMQITAVKATDESVVRNRALSVMRGAAEMMRANPDDAGIQAFVNELNTGSHSASTACMSANADKECSINQLAVQDAKNVKNFAQDNDIDIKAITCPGSLGQSLTCLIAGWGETTATVGSGLPNCIDTTGNYNVGSTCFVMEAY